MTAPLLDAILRHVKARAGADHASWAAAKEAESLAPNTPRQRFGWALGCLVASYRMKPPFRALGYAAALLLAMGLVGLFNWRVDEGGVDMGVLILCSAAAGAALRKRAWLGGLLVGLVIPAQSVFSAMTGLHPAFEKGPSVLRPDPSLLVLVVPALLAALMGGWISRVLFRLAR
jgi:hypothetical protein